MSRPVYTFSPSGTSISYPWPAGLTGIERIALSSQGDLQRILSAFFDRTIQIVPIYTHSRVTLSPGLPDVPLELPNDDALASASKDTPITQTRQVLLQCAGRTVCTATSTVRISSPRVASLFLVEKFPIGQMFRKLEKLPNFELLAVELGVDKETSDGVEGVWRRYRLFVDGFETEILERFPDRQMFERGEKWLVSPTGRRTTASCPAIWHGVVAVAVLCLILFAMIIAHSEQNAGSRQIFDLSL